MSATDKSDETKESSDTSSRMGDVQVTGNATLTSKFDGVVPAQSCTVFPKSGVLAIGWTNGVVQMRDTDTLDELNRLERSTDLPVTSLSGYTSNDAKDMLLASYASGETVLWNAESKEAIFTVHEDRQALVNDISLDHSSFLVGGSDAKISLYDVERQELLHVLQGSLDPEVMDGHTMRVFAVKFHPTQRYEMLSGGWDDTVQFWDVRESFSRRKIRGPHICGDGIEYFGDGKIITASWAKRNSLQMWDYGSGRLIENIKPDDWTCSLYFCRHVRGESVLLSGGSHKNMLRVIDVNTFKSSALFQNLPGAVYFAKELPKKDPDVYTRNICFCSNSSIYIAEIEA